ncbi:helix-turn-helix transcriptional regulator [Laribacter hongkongensis]|jgi:prophage regulatory protein|uniref:helix-turn-helix transcriptional regulator n=1 Tax=Laribacter hongkongensis TaxID=168471 RepID=UPI0018786CEE|nr:AlpA family phage regulatory protein [Laribacter hongkongensis]
MQILRRKAVCEKLGGINDVTLWRITRDDQSFPAAVHINRRIVGWFEHEIDAWLEQRAACRAAPLSTTSTLPPASK